MPASVIGAYRSSAAALTLLRQSAPQTSPAGAPSAPLRYEGTLNSGASAAAYTIETILRNRAIGPSPSSPAGLAQLAEAFGRFRDAGVVLQLRLDGAPAPDGMAEWMGDRNIGFIVNQAAGLAVTPAEALRQYGEITQASASRSGASDFSREIHQAYLDGRIELVPAEEYGVRYETTVTMNFSGNGDFMGGGTTVRPAADGLTFQDLMQTRLQRQEDGRIIDIETGRYATGIYFGGRAFIATFA